VQEKTERRQRRKEGEEQKRLRDKAMRSDERKDDVEEKTNGRKLKNER
jgi:hypothetical protein